MQAVLFAASFFALIVLISLSASAALSNSTSGNSMSALTEKDMQPVSVVDPATAFEYTLILDESEISWFDCSWNEFRCN